MGKKPKPTVHTKLFDKTNNRNFTLVFIKNIINEEAIRAEIKENNQLISRTLLGGLTTSKHRKKIEEVITAQPKDEEDHFSEEEDDNLLDEDDDEDFFHLNVNEGAPRVDQFSKKQSNDDDIEREKAWAQLEQPRNFEHFLEILRNALQLKCEKEKVTFKNDYMIKFNVNFSLISSLSYKNFEDLITILFKLIPKEKSKRFIIEVPFDVINRLKKHMFERRMLPPVYRFCVLNFSMGSIVNLTKYYGHFTLPKFVATMKSPKLLELKFLQRFFAFYFFFDKPNRVYKIHYSFSAFRTIIFERHPEFDRVYFECIQAPMMFYTHLDEQQMEDVKVHEINVCDLPNLFWYRTIKFIFHGNMPRFRNERKPPETTANEDENMLGMSKAFYIDVPNDDPILPKLINMAFNCRERNKTFQFFLSNVEQYCAPRIFETQLKDRTFPFHTFETDQQIGNLTFTFNHLRQKIEHYQFPFPIHFALLVFFSGSYKILDCFTAENLLFSFLDVVLQNADNAADGNEMACLEQCIYHLKSQSRELIILNMHNEFLKLLKIKESFAPEETPDDYVSIRRATLFPSHFEFVHPVSLLKSRFTDLANLEYGIRMTIMDDNGGFLNKCKDQREFDFIMDNLKPKLLNGITIGERTYEILGSSTSQMRDSGCTLYARDSNGRTAEDVRNSAGELKIFNRNVSKYIARFGLVFSQSMTIVEVPEDVHIRYSKDYEGIIKSNTKDYQNVKEERYCLSDGIGIVSEKVARDWVPHLQIKNEYFPSAYQIRFGGCKGMLTVFPMKGTDRAILIRNSMKKYESDSRLMGILKYSLPRSVFLNRPLINILDHMNVDRDELYEYYYYSTASVAKATFYDSCAMDLIHTYSTGILPYEKILNSGISLLDEPFLRSIINYLIYYRLNFELKLKARIAVPNDRGRIAFGVLDETRSLEYGQVFFQYTKMTKDGHMLDETVILEGTVMVTKFPCLQPGDVRKFEAVNIPGLRHVKDCLVFPAKGPRSHCDEMSGSDLDGDEYAIFWDPALYFPGENQPPMDFPYGLSRSLQYDITVEDMVEFLLSYLIRNNIGQVANTHLMYSDFLPEGLDAKECEELAYTYNVSLDFPKTGVILPMPKYQFYLAIRPDFMERNTHDQVYLSKKMLGEYFRHCAVVERAIELSQYDYRFSMFNPAQRKKKNALQNTLNQFKNIKSLIKNRLILPEWKKFRKEAEEAFTEYRIKVIDIMEQLEVENEVMLFADIYEEKKDVAKQLLNHFFLHFQEKFKSQCQQLGCTYTIDRLYLTSAWYAICYEKCLTYNGKPLLGLPWLVAEEVCQLAMFSFSGKVATEATLADSERTMIIDGERWTIRIGVNHKQLVPYLLERALISDMLFDYKTLAVYQTKVIHHYWCPIKLLLSIRANHAHLDSLYYELMEEIQMSIVMHLALKYFYMIKHRIYGDFVENRKVVIYSEKNGPQGESILEGDLLQRIISDKLKEIVRACGRKTTEDIDSLPTISTIFNQLLFYLFEICNRINSAIYHSTMEELFLLKYAVFALSFLNKLDAKLDRRFYIDFSIDFQGQMDSFIFLLNRSQKLRQFDPSMKPSAMFPPTFFKNVYETTLDSLFETFLTDNSCLVEETTRFYLLPLENQIDLVKARDELFPILAHLTGIMDIQFVLSRNDPMPHTDNIRYRQDEDGQDRFSRPPSQADSTDLLNNSERGEELPNDGDSVLSGAVDASTADENIPDQDPVNAKDANVPSQQQQSKKHISQLGKFSRKSEALKNVAYEAKATGLVHSTQMARLLIGHPHFLSNLRHRFSVSVEDQNYM